MNRKNTKLLEFSILMPPPNVSGELHIGHALGFFLQDCLCRLGSLLVGKKNIKLLPGLDHGGISTQYSALKSLEENCSNNEKYKLIYDFAESAKTAIVKQMEQFNIIANFDQLKYTMDIEHVKLVNESFIKLYNKNLIYEEERIVYWDSHFKTSLSTLEVVHKTQEDKLFYIKYKLENENEYITVGTTRPETIFGDVALIVGKKNKHLAGKNVIIPIINKVIPIIFDEEAVLDDFGTGILKITPGHDEKDFNIGKKHKLPIINLFDKNLLMNSNVPLEYVGLSIDDSRKKLLDMLKKENLFEKEEIITHNIMFGEKSGHKIETIVKKQWYLDLSKSAEKSLEMLEEGKWKIFPNYWINTYKQWIKNLQPWCISREILWGHKIPLWRTENNEIIVALSEEEALKKSENKKITRDPFVLDTWFSSALWPLLYDTYPTTLLVTGHDILFFWVARMMMMSLELKNTLPFEKVLLHDLVRDGKGEKMSKTKGNVANPLELINEYGGDVVRYGLLSKISIRGKIRFSSQDIMNGQKLHTKIENVIKFLKIHYKKEDFTENLESITLNNEVVIFFIKKLEEINLNQLFEEYNIDLYLTNLYKYFWHEYCDWFMELSKKQIHNKEFKFAHIYILKKLLCYFYGFFPNLITKTFSELFNSEVSLPNTEIFYGDFPYDNITDFMFIVHQIRSFQANGIEVFVKNPMFNYDNEDLLWNALKIPIISLVDNNKLKEIIIRNKNIYIVHNDKVHEYFLKNIEKKEIEIDIINKKLIENLPKDIVLTFENKVKMLTEETIMLKRYLEIYQK